MKRYLAAVLILLSGCQKDELVDNSPIQTSGEIAFISRRIDNSPDWQLFVMNADGSGQRLISNDIVIYAPPVISHSGTKVAYTSIDVNHEYSLYSINLDGQQRTLLATGTQYCNSPVWTPDDNKLIFTKNEGSSAETHIYSVNSDGTNETRLTQQTGFSPQYNPLNNTIIYCSYVNNITGIYSMNADGSNQRLLSPPGLSFNNPKVSPDGKKIAITSEDWNGSQVFVVNADGTGLVKLTSTASPTYTDIGFPRDGNAEPSWSPNSAQLLYVSYEAGRPDIFIMNANGTGQKRLTNAAQNNVQPGWTSDGKYIVFTSNRQPNNHGEIYIMKPGGQMQTPLTQYLSDDVFPVFFQR